MRIEVKLVDFDKKNVVKKKKYWEEFEWDFVEGGFYEGKE